MTTLCLISSIEKVVYIYNNHIFLLHLYLYINDYAKTLFYGPCEEKKYPPCDLNQWKV